MLRKPELGLFVLKAFEAVKGLGKACFPEVYQEIRWLHASSGTIEELKSWESAVHHQAIERRGRGGAW